MSILYVDELEGGSDGGREGGREGRREGEIEGRRVRGRERGSDGREGGREGGRQGAGWEGERGEGRRGRDGEKDRGDKGLTLFQWVSSCLASSSIDDHAGTHDGLACSVVRPSFPMMTITYSMMMMMSCLVDPVGAEVANQSNSGLQHSSTFGAWIYVRPVETMVGE